MTSPLCKVADILFIRFELKDLGPQKEYLEHFGMHLAHATEDKVYFRGTGASPFIYVAQKGAEDRFLGTGYWVESFEELEKLANAHNVTIEENLELGGGYKVAIQDLDGFGVEVFHGLKMMNAEAAQPPIMNTGTHKFRVNDLQRFGAAADEWQLGETGEWEYKLRSNVMRLGHTAINVADAQAAIKWYEENLGMIITDSIVMPDGSVLGAFVRCDRGTMAVDHHTINILGVTPGNEQFVGNFGHGGFEVRDSVDDLLAGHYHLKTTGKYYHEWGLGRHLLGSQIYDYWRDPQGFTLEHWTDGDMLDVSVPTKDVPARDTVLAQFGPLVPATFGLSMSVDEVDSFRANNPSLSEVVKMMELGPPTGE